MTQFAFHLGEHLVAAVSRELRAAQVRFSVDPADIPPEKVARRLHLTLAQFVAVRTRLFMRGFPLPDIDTGMYCLEAVDRWRLQRYPALFPELPRFDAAVITDGSGKDLGTATREVFGRKPAKRNRKIDDCL
ncbi:hypothetical protein ACLBYG_15125 [Methylobacterium sp. D53M]